MTTGAPAGALAQFAVVWNAANINASILILLEMAFQAQVRIAFGEHFDIDAAVRGMAGGAAFAHGLVLKNERSELPRVALGADIFLGHKFRATAHDHGTLVRTMAIAAIDPALKNRVMRRQMKFSLLVQVTLETHLR